MASVRADGTKIRHYRSIAGLTQEELARRAGYSKRLVEKVEQGAQTKIDTLCCIAEVLGVDVQELIRDAADSIAIGSEWDIDKKRRIGRQRVAANSLRYDVFRIPSKRVKGRAARAKLYDRGNLSTRDEQKTLEKLTRHSEICFQLRDTPFVPRLITSVGDNHGGYWWILDEWVDGLTLDQRVKSRGPSLHPPNIMRQLAQALHALHEQGIIRRELSPSSIIVREDNGNLLLTDFELGKLLEGVPTVSPEKGWRKDNPFIAPEIVIGGEASPAADWYSWAMILGFMLTPSSARTRQQSFDAIQHADLPNVLKRLLTQCLEQIVDKRPTSKQLFKAIKGWK